MPKEHKVINLEGTTFVLVPYSDYVRMMEALQNAKHRPQKKSPPKADKPKIPEEVSWRLRKGESPVKAWRKYRNLTQKQLAAKVGVATSAISLIETGARHGKAETLEAVARMLNVPLIALRHSSRTER